MKITVNGQAVPSLVSLVYGLGLLSLAGVVFGFEVRVTVLRSQDRKTEV